MKNRTRRLQCATVMSVLLLAGAVGCGNNNEPNNTDNNPTTNNTTMDNPVVSPSSLTTAGVGDVTEYKVTGLDDNQAYRITLVVADNVTVSGASGTFVDNDENGAADAGASEEIALITSVNGADQDGAKTVPGGMDDPASPSGVFPSGGEITLEVTGVAAGTVYPVVYHNGGDSTFLEIDENGAPTETHVVGGGLTIEGGDVTENPMASPSTDSTIDVDGTVDYTVSGLNPEQAYRITLVVDGNVTVSGGAGTFVDNDENGAADAGASENVALITSVNGEAQDGAKTVPGGTDDPAAPSGVFPSDNGEITLTVTGVAAGTVYPVIYHNGGESTFLEIDSNGAPIETHLVAGGVTVEGGGDSLYAQLGGEAAIRAVLDEFIVEVAADDRINWMFANSDLDMLKNMLHDQVCEATGGGCTYTGEDMKTAHTGMAITDAQFDALIEDFLAALDTLGVPYALDGTETIDPLLMALVGMKGDIVEDAAGDMVLFNQLGGYAAVGVVVDEILSVVAADTRINGFFANTDLMMLRALLIEQICEATGGYCVYSGRTMLESHAGLGISEGHWNAFIEDTLTALDNLGIPYALDGTETIDPLLVALVGMKGDIVEEAPVASPDTTTTIATAGTVDYTFTGLSDMQAYRITLVVDGNITVNGDQGTFVDNDNNGAADAGASEATALITSVNGTSQAGAKTVPGGGDDPAAPSGVFPSGGEITITVTGVAAGTVYPVLYHNGGSSTFLEIDSNGAPIETHLVAGGVTVQ